MEGVVLMEFLKQGQTVNSKRTSISILRALKLRLRIVRHDKDSILQHDNAGTRISRQTQDVLGQLELKALLDPAYSSDLAPSDYYPKLKKYLKGHHYDNDDEIIAHVLGWCRGQSSEFFADGVHHLVKR
ncbi:histone-lysine N-methyltransferase SETMAR [Elysia marginata]|uniref:Histone-lysine N-methyltransferase SETMAR n=1 Tax=Elysia marginata TaxID=1093978 RepID=A0AAV4JGM6_9GAST|nr:histone-lysine N-methyltransferase SETMAR [Elysia marginata]